MRSGRPRSMLCAWRVVWKTAFHVVCLERGHPEAVEEGRLDEIAVENASFSSISRGAKKLIGARPSQVAYPVMTGVL